MAALQRARAEELQAATPVARIWVVVEAEAEAALAAGLALAVVTGLAAPVGFWVRLAKVAARRAARMAEEAL